MSLARRPKKAVEHDGGPACRLAVQILGAQGLGKAMGLPLACTCEIPGRADVLLKTKVVEYSPDPVWDEEFEIPQYQKGDSLVFTIYAQSPQPTPDELLGRAELPSAQLSGPGGLDAELPLELPRGAEQGTAWLRVRVGHIAAGTTPSMPSWQTGFNTMVRARSAPRADRPAAPHPTTPSTHMTMRAQESALLAVVRRQMESLEERLRQQLARAQQQGERLQEAAIARLESKVGAVETLQPRIEKKLAELGGNCKALSDEMLARFHEVDEQESKFRDWRKQYQEEARSKMADLESECHRTASALKTLASRTDASLTRDDGRLARMERLLDDRQAQHEEASQGLLALHARLTDLEDCAPGQLQPQRDLADPFVLNMEGKLGDLHSKLSNIVQDTHEAYSRMEAQEQRLNSLHAQQSNKEDQHRRLSDRVERVPHLEGRFKDLEARMQEFAQHKLEHHERLDMLTTRVASSEQAHDEARQVLSKFDPAIDTQDSAARLETLEAQLDEVRSELELHARNTDEVLAPRLSTLIEQLREMPPRFKDQELQISDLGDRVKQVEKALGWHHQRGGDSPQRLNFGGEPNS